MKKFIRLLKIWDGVWSVPVAIFLFLAAGYGIERYYGPEAGSMVPSYLQRLFYASLCMVLCNFTVLLGFNMNFSGVFKWYVKDSAKDFRESDPKFKIKVFILVYFLYFAAFTIFLVMS